MSLVKSYNDLSKNDQQHNIRYILMVLLPILSEVYHIKLEKIRILYLALSNLIQNKEDYSLFHFLYLYKTIYVHLYTYLTHLPVVHILSYIGQKPRFFNSDYL